ncbi:MAG: phenylalanine--tRNA ligase subunit alpha [Euryarchaeota archaeon]|nr:phenylalanine--tRNA ligase subunit alpha [Euryarchaeota archaeon]
MEELSKNDLLVLQTLKRFKKMPVETLAKETGLKFEAALQSAYFLHTYGFAQVIETVDTIYRLTDEGSSYAEKGLPERQVHDYLLIHGPTRLAGLKSLFPAVSVAIGWLKRRRWASFAKEDGESLLVPEAADEAPEERLLREVRYRPHFRLADVSLEPQEAQHALQELARRNLVRTHDTTAREVVLTGKGEDTAQFGQYSTGRDVSVLTSDMIRDGTWRDRLKPYDVQVDAAPLYPGKGHPLRRLIDEMRDIFIAMGFAEFKGPVVENEFHNFDVLFVPQDHPARDEQDTFYLRRPAALELPTDLVKRVAEAHISGCQGSIGWGGEFDLDRSRRTVLRTHTTGSAFRYLVRHPEPPAMIFGIDRVFRRESMDSTHLPQFHQCEGTIHGDDLSLADLIGVLKTVFRRLGFTRIRFRPGYFPFTEPSLEGDIFVNGRWMELVGAGVFRPEVTEPLGLKSVLGFSIGIERIAMLKLGLNDIRKLYMSDIAWLREVPSETL